LPLWRNIVARGTAGSPALLARRKTQRPEQRIGIAHSSRDAAAQLAHLTGMAAILERIGIARLAATLAHRRHAAAR
jgi:hypothetical protein